jgi:DNA helicase-2/ATP-dependent DNA helicase PcrA
MPTESSAESAFGASLNAAQRQAATYGVDGSGRCGPLLVIAGAGTGKTNTLAHRVAYLLTRRVPPQRIALMTFSRRAAQEMLHRAERIAAQSLAGTRMGSLVTASTRQLWSGTFHALGNRLLREYAGSLGLDANFSVLDRGDSADLIDIVRHDLGLAGKAKRFPRKDTCLSIYSHRVNTRNSLAQSLEQAYPWCAEWAAELAQLFRGYVRAKQAQQLLDYDDLLLYWHTLMQEPALARDIGMRFDHVLVDEYQDTNSLQADILFALKPDGEGLCVVGDDAQSIYSFRAATVDNILEFPSRFAPAAQVITLDQNYRSVQPILDAANALMHEGTGQFEKNLRSDRKSGQKPRYVMVEDDRSQALYVVEQILAHREEGTLLRDQAVLMRKSSDSDVLELELIRRDIPYVKYGGLKFLEAAHVKDVLALLRFVDNPRNRLAGFRTLQLLPGMGPANAERCLGLIEQSGGTLTAIAAFDAPGQAEEDWPAFVALATALSSAPEWAGQMTQVRRWYEPHLERLHGAAEVRAGDLAQLEALATAHGSRETFLTELTLDPPQASGDEAGPPHLDEDYLILSTVHSAKGQEWDSVYMLNVVDGTFPNEFAAASPALIEEERRLLYVAMTRAKRNLHLVSPLKFYVPQQRRFGDKHVYGARSRFMTEAVLATFDSQAWPAQGAELSTAGPAQRVRIDAGALMRDMWND